MASKCEKVRILVSIPIELKEKAEKIAKNDNRSLSNYVVTLVQKDVEKNTMPAK